MDVAWSTRDTEWLTVELRCRGLAGLCGWMAMTMAQLKSAAYCRSIEWPIRGVGDGAELPTNGAGSAKGSIGGTKQSVGGVEGGEVRWASRPQNGGDTYGRGLITSIVATARSAQQQHRPLGVSTMKRRRTKKKRRREARRGEVMTQGAGSSGASTPAAQETGGQRRESPRGRTEHPWRCNPPKIAVERRNDGGARIPDVTIGYGSRCGADDDVRGIVTLSPNDRARAQDRGGAGQMQPEEIQSTMGRSEGSVPHPTRVLPPQRSISLGAIKIQRISSFFHLLPLLPPPSSSSLLTPPTPSCRRCPAPSRPHRSSSSDWALARPSLSRRRRRALSPPPRPGPTAGNHRPAGGAPAAAPRRPAAHLLHRAGLPPPELPLGFGALTSPELAGISPEVEKKMDLPPLVREKNEGAKEPGKTGRHFERKILAGCVDDDTTDQQDDVSCTEVWGWVSQRQFNGGRSGSLFLQYFLYFAAPLRKRSSDALAIYALAALFNRHKKTLSKNASLEALWAPILLVHLGGYSLIGYLASKRKHKTLTSITAFLGCEDYLDPLWCMKPFNWAMFITWLVTRFVETWKRDHGSEGGRAFNDNRGHWTLKRHGCGGSNILRESLRRPFDESVLVWHLATEFCCFDRMDNIPDNDDDALYHLATCYFAHLDALWSKNKNKNTGSNDDAGDDNTGDDNTGGNDDGEDNNTGGNDAGSNNTGDDNTGGNDAGNNNTGDDNTGGNNADVDNTGGNSTGDDDSIDNDALANVRISCVISNYMAYLLFVNPEMLMTGARPSLFRNAYKRLNGMLLDDGEERTAALTEKDLAQKIIQELKGGAKGRGIIDDAWALSQELTKLCNDDNDKMWKVIFGVWVEMLCFSASRCRGYLHAKSLGKGGEYLSYIWLAPRAQDPPEQQDDDGSGAGAEFTDTTSTTPARTIISDMNEKAGPQEKASHGGAACTTPGAACTTPAPTVIGDEKRDEDAAPAIPVIGDENV
ncbi:hypothetical protein HU200_038138 [Digitaria exilis]|uniref:DUF4220 domain-containing protein n=1 Tax=Digitaria exilis TaxID=1010633 RepID=A0A835EIQ5_9POAL|nr:hypothetical protein HU200_038138 [Digitaria exilis]